MTSFRVHAAAAADAAAVTAVRVALETSLYGQSSLSQADVEDEWSDLDLERNARVIRDGERVVGFGAVRQEGELWEAEGFAHPDALGRGIGALIATGLEEHAARCGARRIHTVAFEVDSAARRLLQSLGYSAVRVFREMRIEVQTPPPAPTGRTGYELSRSTSNGTRSSSTPRARRRLRIIGSTPRASSNCGRGATLAASVLTRRSGASFARETRLPPERSAPVIRTGAAGCTYCSRVGRGASTASVRRF